MTALAHFPYLLFLVEVVRLELTKDSLQRIPAPCATPKFMFVLLKDQYKQNTLLLTVMQRTAYLWYGRSLMLLRIRIIEG